MSSGTVASIVLNGAGVMGIELPPGAAQAFEAYYKILDRGGEIANLTAIKGAADVANLHFLDSIALLKAARFSHASLIDIGSGAGFPGVPIKISEPSVNLTILDSSVKRTAFLTGLCSELDIETSIIQDRAEIAAHYQEMRESFDIAVSRAVARLNILCELCLPFVTVGGAFIAMKGSAPAAEIFDAEKAVKTLGGQIIDVCSYMIPGTDIEHSAVIISKTTETPKKYPRRFARIKTSPL